MGPADFSTVRPYGLTVLRGGRMVKMAAMTGSWRSLFRRADAPPPARAPSPRREALPVIPFKPRTVARIRLVRRVVRIPGTEAS